MVTYIRSLDMCFNNIRIIKGLDTLVKLEKLYLINNKIKKIEKLDQLTCLTMLELGDNRIRVRLNISNVVIDIDYRKLKDLIIL